MYGFFGQPKYKIHSTDGDPSGYELFMREYVDGNWELPADFKAGTAAQLEHLLSKVVTVLPDSVVLVSFNLEQNQFINPTFADMIEKLQKTTDITLVTELTERTDPAVSIHELYNAAKRFHEKDLFVCIDDVGTGDNTPQMVIELDEFIDEYKFALQNFRPFNKIDDIADTLNFWHSLATQRNKLLVIEGVESEEELNIVKDKYPCHLIQGFYTGRPRLLVEE